MEINLCPAQQTAFNWLSYSLTRGNIVTVWGKKGWGKTTLLKAAQQKYGGVFLNTTSLLEGLSQQNPHALEEAFFSMMRSAIDEHDLVMLDDYHRLRATFCENHMYPRKGLLDALLTELCDYASEANKKLILGIASDTPEPIAQRTHFTGVKRFCEEDYQFLCRVFLQNAPELAERLDYKEIYRVAPKLSAHQLKLASNWIRQSVGAGVLHYVKYLRELESFLDEKPDFEDDRTPRFIEYLTARSWIEKSNIDLDEVQAIELKDIKGVDDIIESLEANLILPFENEEMARELRLRPKRGVLLAGPPGTGKTSIGRALAHRLKSKFFLIDGTLIAGTGDFYQGVQKIFEEAKKNRPSIIFIDDTDVIFESGQAVGLYRYLLTMLDGLESTTADQVCVMMTAMDVDKLPPALIRSGRIELWLETRLPDEAARIAILSGLLDSLPAPFDEIELGLIAESTDGFTGADLKRLIEDGKTLYAYDKLRSCAQEDVTGYFLSAIDTVRSNKLRYAVAESRARQRSAAHTHEPAYYED